jgi:DNA primase
VPQFLCLFSFSFLLQQMIPESFIQELLSRIDIVEVINKVSPLKRTGKNFMCCCPFHKEKTPSFSVSQQKQFFKCFGCGASGNVIGFLMRYEGLSYPEAIRKLAESIGMTVPETPRDRETRTRVRSLTDMMKAASDYYSASLKTNTRTIEYLKQRGITGETAARFALGYSPDAWQPLKDVFGDQYASKDLEEEGGCGLVIHNGDKRYDRFRGRLMFPIRNPRGQVIAFGARTLNGDEHPKYLNSPETALYHKSREIYGLYEASASIREKHRAIVCEGYMDVIQLSQAGFTEACAALGTAVTAEHVQKLLRAVDTVYFSFDGDSAGQHALRRALEAALPVVEDDQEIRFVVLPPEHDPDSLIKEKGAQAFEDELQKSLTLTQYFVRTVSQGKDLGTAEGRSQFVAESKPLIVSMRSAPILRKQLVGELAMHARMSPDEIERLCGIASVRKLPAANPATGMHFDARRNRSYGGFTPRKPFFGTGGEPVSLAPTSDIRERLLQNLLNYPALAVEFSSRIEEEFVGSEAEAAREILEVWRTVTADEEPLLQSQLILERLQSSRYYAHYCDLVAREMVLQTPENAARVEVELTFDRLELQRIESNLMQATLEAKPDIQRIMGLDTKRKVLKARIDEVQKQFALHHGAEI